MNPTDLLNKFFDIHPLGIEICPGADPPKEAWEALVLHLAANNDELAWQVGATCNRYPKKYHDDIYVWFATLLNLSHWTIQQYAYIERHIPSPSRISNLSIWHHRPVAKVEGPLQRVYLETCRKCGWGVTQFEMWLEGKGIEVEEQHYQSDRQYETDRQIQATIDENAALRNEVRALRAELETAPKTGDGPQFLPAPVTKLIHGVASYLQGRQWAAVIIHGDGRVEWIPRDNYTSNVAP